MNESKAAFKKRCYGIVMVKSENSNFNADFTGNPRRLPDQKSTIYATDKALKYAIRKYWVDTGKHVFVWKTFRKENEEYLPLTLEERFNDMKTKLKESSQGKDLSPLDIFAQCIDTRLFGITFAMKSKKAEENRNISLTGPVQITYGVNRLNENIIFSNDILSPYASKPGDKSSTIGNENKAREIYYVFDFVINPQNILNHYENNPEVLERMTITESDISSLKEALKYAVTNLNSSSKIGSENILTLFITLNENSRTQIPVMKNLVNIEKETDKTKIDLEAVSGLLSTYDNDIESIELFFNEKLLNVPYPIENKKWEQGSL
jgi:CRISPR-associated protein Csh2